MIERVLLIGQGPNDVGFLEGLRDRLRCGECAAHLTSYQNQDRDRDKRKLRQRGSYTRKKDAKYIWEHSGDVDLIVRLTDGDTEKPQDTIRKELERWPPDARGLLVCGVCDRDIEHWMCLDPDYAAEKLGFDKKLLPERRQDRSGFIKNRIRQQCGDQKYTAFVAGFVENAPPDVFRRWLSNPAFGRFYDDCRAAAARHECPVKNLRDPGEADA